MFSAKAGPGLSINTTAANANSSTTQSTAAGGLFGSSNTNSQPQQGGGLFGNLNSTSQPQQSTGGLFGNSNTSSQPQQSGGLFGNLNASKPQQSGGLFGSSHASSQPQQTGGSFVGVGGSTSQPQQQSGGLFGSSAGSSLQSQQSGGPFGISKPAQTGGLFGGLGQSTQQSQPVAASSLFGNTTSQPGASTTTQPGPSNTSATKIDLAHLRPTTKWDHLSDDLATEVQKIDQAILDTIARCNEVSDLLPTIASAGANLPNDVAFVSSKLDELETGLENDAGEIESLRGVSKKDVGEARVVFRGVDRLKMPLQYQQGGIGDGFTASGGGWWNHPQTLQRTMRAVGSSSRGIQLPGEDDESEAGPANLVDFFSTRTDEMSNVLDGYKATLKEIEEHLGVVEASILAKQREVRNGGGGLGGNADEQLQRLKATLGVFESGIVGVAGKVADAQGKVADQIATGDGGSNGGSLNGFGTRSLGRW